ncbi:MAG: type II toxin-antitoxin system VapC family toxin [Chloroflexota bacterium]|nr:type II toxin-antitoxin system VapC family toxin [Chloroflexota bacterium]MDE2959009.1 type II toxin-antitoxin system VapC family toxin [Chloroflexota bacterium]
MNTLALDTSVAAAWVLDDENEPYANAAFSLLPAESALVPRLWHLELRNVLLSAERMNRLSPVRAGQHLAALAALPIDTDDDTDLNTAYELAKTYRLTIYDAVYLELATRRGVLIATLDNALRRAAQSEDRLWQP